MNTRSKKEADYQSAIIKDLESFGVENVTAFKITKANIDSIPDLFIVSKTGCFLVELKKPGEKPEKGQEYMIKLFNTYGPHLRSCCVRSWEEWVALRKETILPNLTKG